MFVLVSSVVARFLYSMCLLVSCYFYFCVNVRMWMVFVCVYVCGWWCVSDRVYVVLCVEVCVCLCV